MPDKPELQTQLQEALGLDDADFAYHESDLYVVAKPGVMEWLEANYAHVGNVRVFHSPDDSGWNGAGKRCYDIPFAGLDRRALPITGPQSFKTYACSRCGHEKEIKTNHWGECYSSGDFNVCVGCPPIDRPTVWECQEEPPEPVWDELTDQVHVDLLAWFNIAESDVDASDRRRLAALYNAGKFHAWNCPDCGERVYEADPDDWDHFQGSLQVDRTSYPGDAVRYNAEYILKQCDDCRRMCPAIESPEPIGL